MNSILFMYIETETEKLSGHIDLTARYPSCRVFNFTNLKYYQFSGSNLRTSFPILQERNSFCQLHETSRTSGQFSNYLFLHIISY